MIYEFILTLKKQRYGTNVYLLGRNLHSIDYSRVGRLIVRRKMYHIIIWVMVCILIYLLFFHNDSLDFFENLKAKDRNNILCSSKVVNESVLVHSGYLTSKDLR